MGQTFRASTGAGNACGSKILGYVMTFSISKLLFKTGRDKLFSKCRLFSRISVCDHYIPLHPPNFPNITSMKIKFCM